MKKIQFLILVTSLVASCSLFGKASDDTVYVVTDRVTNKALSAYYCDADDRVVRTETYAVDQLVKRARDFEYDADGYVRSMTELVPGVSSRTVNYTTEISRSADGRIERIVQSSDAGEVFETTFGYDETGTLRGAVLKAPGDSVIKKDYADE